MDIHYNKSIFLIIRTLYASRDGPCKINVFIRKCHSTRELNLFIENHNAVFTVSEYFLFALFNVSNSCSSFCQIIDIYMYDQQRLSYFSFQKQKTIFSCLSLGVDCTHGIKN